MKLKQLIFGIATFVPGTIHLRARGTGGTDSARYCYSVWLRHLVMAKNNGLDPYPKTVAELGPGDSLGIGLAALISGCDRYFAFDIVEHAKGTLNKKIFDELVLLFMSRTPIPGQSEFPQVEPCLDCYDFPADILDENRMRYALEKNRIARIRESINDNRQTESLIQYKVPWHDMSDLAKESVDMLYSQAVLEHIDDLRGAYGAMHSWLKPYGYISHQIDFQCHGTADEWNGHWLYSDFVWRLIRGRRQYLINREPHSTHISLLSEEGFEILCDKKNISKSNISVNNLSSRFQSISEDDLITSGTFIQAVKKN